MDGLGKLVRVLRVEPLQDLIVRVEFEDGTVKQIELSPLMHGPIFDELRYEQALFQDVAVERGTLTWPNGADIDPDVLHYGLVPASAEATGHTR